MFQIMQKQDYFIQNDTYCVLICLFHMLWCGILQYILFYVCVSDPVNNIHPKIEPMNKIFIKEEPVDDALRPAVSQEHQFIKKEEVIDIEHEPLQNENENSILNLVSFVYLWTYSNEV